MLYVVTVLKGRKLVKISLKAVIIFGCLSVQASLYRDVLFVACDTAFGYASDGALKLKARGYAYRYDLDLARRRSVKAEGEGLYTIVGDIKQTACNAVGVGDVNAYLPVVFRGVEALVLQGILMRLLNLKAL